MGFRSFVLLRPRSLPFGTTATKTTTATKNFQNAFLRKSLISPTKRYLSVIGKEDERYRLPRMYVGPRQESILSLSQFLSQPPQSTTAAPVVLQEGSIVSCSPAQAHYVTSVMRMVGPKKRKGGRYTYGEHEPCIRLFNGHDDQEWVAHLQIMNDIGDIIPAATRSKKGGDKKKQRRRKSGEEAPMVLAHCFAPILNSNQIDNNPPQDKSRIRLQPILGFAPPKSINKDRYPWILEKSTELGVAAWMLLDTDRSETSTAGDYYERKGQAYVVEAAEQCERLTIPLLVSLTGGTSDDQKEDETDVAAGASMDVLFGGDSSNKEGADDADLFTSLSSLFQALCNGELPPISVLVCRERSPKSTPILQALQQIQHKQDKDHPHNCLVLIGPEGGWSPSEEAMFEDEALSETITNVSLGTSVLRTDTAAVTAMAAFALLE